ncbi:unnamed protein product, partial [Amoebophrya sp. A120]|eukprot:GSA120T00017709001.1
MWTLSGIYRPVFLEAFGSRNKCQILDYKTIADYATRTLSLELELDVGEERNLRDDKANEVVLAPDGVEGRTEPNSNTGGDNSAATTQVDQQHDHPDELALQLTVTIQRQKDFPASPNVGSKRFPAARRTVFHQLLQKTTRGRANSTYSGSAGPAGAPALSTQTRLVTIANAATPQRDDPTGGEHLPAPSATCRVCPVLEGEGAAPFGPN